MECLSCSTVLYDAIKFVIDINGVLNALLCGLAKKN